MVPASSSALTMEKAAWQKVDTEGSHEGANAGDDLQVSRDAGREAQLCFHGEALSSLR